MRLDEIASAPLPATPMSFGWNWWAMAFFMTLALSPPVVFGLIARVNGTMLPVAIACLIFPLAMGYYVYGYLRFAVKGPAFVLDAKGIAFAGKYLRWQDVIRIEYNPYGKTSNISFRHDGSQIIRFNPFGSLDKKTSISTYFIGDPEAVFCWSRRFKEEFERNRASLLASSEASAGLI